MVTNAEQAELAKIRAHLADRLRADYPQCQPLQIDLEIHRAGPTLVCEIYLWGERLYKNLAWNAMQGRTVKQVVECFLLQPGFREFFVFAGAAELKQSPPVKAVNVERYLRDSIDEAWPLLKGQVNVQVDWIPEERRFVVMATCWGEQFTGLLGREITPTDTAAYIGMQIVTDPLWDQFFHQFIPENVSQRVVPISGLKVRRLIKT